MSKGEQIMRQEKFYVINVERALINADALYDEAYTWALEQKGLSLDDVEGPITRALVRERFPELSQDEEIEIWRLKNQYCIDHPEKTTINEELKAMILEAGADHCIYTTAGVGSWKTIKAFLRYYGLDEAFCMGHQGERTGHPVEVECYKELFICRSQDLVFYEEDERIVTSLKEQGLEVRVAKRS